MIGRAVIRCFLLLVNFFALAQNVGIGTTSPHPSAKLDIKANNQGLLIPRLTTAQRNAISNPAHSLLIFNIDNFCIEVYDSVSGQWLAVSCPIACPVCDTIQCLAPTVDSIRGPVNVCPGDTVKYVLYGSGGLTYVWNLPNGWAVINMSQQGEFVAGSSGTIYGHLCNECGCSTDSLLVSVGSPPASVVLTTTDSICLGDTLVVNASGGVSYNWYVPTGWTVIYQGDSLIAVPSDTGMYYVGAEACNSCGCSPKDSVSVVVVDTVIAPVSIAGPTFVCAGDTVVYYASPGGYASVSWQVPSSWTVLRQSGDSLVVAVDTTDGQVIVEACNTLNCKCVYDTITVTADSCLAFCIAIGGSGDDRGFEIIKLQSGDYAIIGITNSFGLGGYDSYILRIDKNTGNIVWQTTHGTTSSDRYAASQAIGELSDGSIIGIMEYGGGHNNVLLFKLDGSTGSLVSSTRLTWTLHYPALYIKHDTIYLSAYAGGLDYGVGLYDQNLTPLNEVILSTSSVDYATDIKSSANVVINLGYIGYCVSLFATDKNLNLLWGPQVYTSSCRICAYDIESDGCDYNGRIALISKYSFAIASNYVIGKYETLTGSVLWHYSGQNLDIRFRSVAYDVTSNKLYIVGETRNSAVFGGRDGILLVLDTLGNVLQAYIIGGVGEDILWDVIVDGSFLVIVGETTSMGAGNQDVYVIKTLKDNPMVIQNICQSCQITPISVTLGSPGPISTSSFTRTSVSGTATGGSNGTATGVATTCP